MFSESCSSGRRGRETRWDQGNSPASVEDNSVVAQPVPVSLFPAFPGKAMVGEILTPPRPVKYSDTRACARRRNSSLQPQRPDWRYQGPRAAKPAPSRSRIARGSLLAQVPCSEPTAPQSNGPGAGCRDRRCLRTGSTGGLRHAPPFEDQPCETGIYNGPRPLALESNASSERR